MKKLLLLTLALGFGIASMAQVRQIQPKAWYSTVTLEATAAVDDPQPVYENEINPYVTNSVRDLDIVIGETWYDLQSNSSMSNRNWTWDDGTMAAVWTRGMDNPPTCPDRGTGYNYHDGAGWGPYPTERIESERTGWPTIRPYGENGEIIVAHTGGASGLLFSYRMQKGTGDWTEFYLAGPAAVPDLTWPRMVTSGENNDVIHVIATAGNAVEYEGLINALLYSRSSDGGQTWDYENVILDGLGADYTHGWGGDSYAWATPKGDTIAFVAGEGTRDGVLMKSNDGGDTWERTTFYESPDPYFDGNGGNSPRWGGTDGYNAVVLDKDGMAHVVAGRMCYADDTPDDEIWSYYPYTDGLIYWNENMPAMDSATITADILPDDWTTHPLYMNGQLAAWVQPNEDGDTLSNIATYQGSLSSMPTLAIIEDINGVDILQLFYGGVTVGYVRPDQDLNNYRHIWGRFTEMDGEWSEFTDYTGDIFHLFKESAYPTVSQNVVGGKFDVLYQTDDIPGNSLQPATPTHAPVLNEMVYLPVQPLPVDVKDQFSVNFEVSQNQPNPAVNETWVMVNTEKRGQINFTVSNLLGQVVYTDVKAGQTLGAHAFRVDVSSFESGIYLYTVKVGDKAVTKKMLVK